MAERCPESSIDILERWSRALLLQRGHLLPQSLAVHAGLDDALRLRTLRVQRLGPDELLFGELGGQAGLFRLRSGSDHGGPRRFQLGTLRPAVERDHELARRHDVALAVRQRHHETAHLRRQLGPPPHFHGAGAGVGDGGFHQAAAGGALDQDLLHHAVDVARLLRGKEHQHVIAPVLQCVGQRLQRLGHRDALRSVAARADPLVEQLLRGGGQRHMRVADIEGDVALAGKSAT